MSYHGDIALGDTIDIKFCTVQSTGAPITLAGSPVISAYVGNGTTEITAGITLTVDFDSRTGMHNCRVVASGGNGFAAQTNVQLVITTGTINSVSAVGYEIGSFSIENRTALRPTTAGRTLDVAASGALDTDSLTAIANAILTDGRLGYKGTGTSAGGSASTIILATGDVAAKKVKAGDIIYVLADGLIDGQAIDSIAGDTCTMVGTWAVNNPDTDDTYYIYAAASALNGNGIATALLDLADAIEAGLTLRQATRLILADAAGDLSGGGTGTEVIKNPVAKDKNRITANTDASGNRTITTDVS